MKEVYKKLRSLESQIAKTKEKLSNFKVAVFSGSIQVCDYVEPNRDEELEALLVSLEAERSMVLSSLDDLYYIDIINKRIAELELLIEASDADRERCIHRIEGRIATVKYNALVFEYNSLLHVLKEVKNGY